jgi:CRP-like cAMP-binding protein
MVIYSGKACAEVDGRHVTELQPGHFIGSISYVTEEMAPANVVASEPTRYVSWPKSKLKDFMNKNPDLHSARLPVKLSADEQRLCELVFRTMTPREMIKLLKLATWKNTEAGETLKSTLAINLTRWLQATWARGASQNATRTSSESDLDAAFATLVEQRASALLVNNDAFFSSRHKQRRATRCPTFSWTRSAV